jgi:trehalose/maltose hydrolase-like predicted phosphorylase
MASLAGAWTALVAGFGGLRDDEGVLSLDPHLPDGISCLRFRLRWRDFRLTIDVNHDDVTYTVRDGPDASLTIRHAGENLELGTERPTTVEIRPCHPLLPQPQQPAGRAPLRRRPS